MYLKKNEMTKGYTLNCKETQEVESEECFAKEIYDRSLKKNYFYVKFCLEGYDKGNPQNPYTMSNYRNVYGWKRVEKDFFDLYLRFLKTTSEHYLIRARKL